MFVELSDNVYVNVSDIVEFNPGRHRDRPTLVKLRGGRVVEMPSYRARSLERAVMPVIPAQPGFEMLFFNYDTSPSVDHFVTREPVIGWRMMPYGPEPVGPEDEGESRDAAIKYPDGQVVLLMDATYATEADWLADAVKRAEMRLAAEKTRQRAS